MDGYEGEMLNEISHYGPITASMFVHSDFGHAEENGVYTVMKEGRKIRLWKIRQQEKSEILIPKMENSNTNFNFEKDTENTTLDG